MPVYAYISAFETMTHFFLRFDFFNENSLLNTLLHGS